MSRRTPGVLRLVAVWAFVAVLGFSWWATNPLTTSLTADIYGLKFLGTLSGLSFSVHQIGAAASVLFAGIMHDVTGSYNLPFAIVGSLLVLATISAFRVEERRYSARYQPRPYPSPSAAG